MQQSLQPLLLLCTGTLVVIANQVVSNQAAVSPKAQMLTLMRYLCTNLLSALLVLRERRQSNSSTRTCTTPAQPKKTAQRPQQQPRRRGLVLLVLLGVGCLDYGCYSLYNLGFALCGSALATILLAASGQLATAALSVLVLKRQLRARHIAAVTVVTVGLVLRSMDDLLAGSLFSSSTSSTPAAAAAGGSNLPLMSGQAAGALCIVLSAVLFSVLGVIYEKRSENPNKEQRVSQAQATFAISGVSLALTLIHQLLYCLPNWQQLVTQPLAASGLSARQVLLTHAAYGAITAGHQFVQLRVLATAGAMSVGLINALRAAVVSLVSSLLFCSVKPQLCLTFWRGASAAVVTIGAVQWLLAGKPQTRADEKKDKAE